MARHVTHARWLVMLLIMGLALVAPQAHAAGTTLRMHTSVSPSLHVSVTGSLHADGEPVKRAILTANLDGRPVARAITRGNGQFEMGFDIPQDMRSGTRRLEVTFAGSGRAGRAQSAATLVISEPAASPRDDDRSPRLDPVNPPGAPAQDAPAQQQPTTPEAQPIATTLKASADSPSPSNGDLIHISGSLLTGKGVGLADAGIELHDDKGEVAEAYVVTNDDGHFTTNYEIPIDRKTPITLRAVFSGVDGYPAASATIDLKVRFRDSATESPTPSPSPEPTETPAEAQPSVSPTESMTHADGATSVAESDAARGLLNGLFGIIIGVGVVVAAATALILWGVSKRHDARRLEGAQVDSFALLDDDGPQDDAGPRPPSGPTPGSGPVPRRAAL